jgi:signal transduction histidine kinase
MVTAFGDVATAVEAIKLGAYDFVEKPPQISRICLTIRRALERAALEREIRELGKSAQERSSLKQANDKLIELDRIKTAFLSSISHELRTPLTSIIGFAQINWGKLAKLVPRISDPKAVREIGRVGENLQILVAEARKLTELVDNVLELTAIEAGTARWSWAPVYLHEIVGDVVGSLADSFSQKGIALVTELAQDLPPVRGDRERLCRVLKHLLSNALKFTDHGRVTCSAVHVDSAIEIRVCDTGVGIADSLHRVIFEKFRQLGDPLTDKPKGVGLGLPICKLIVECHGGVLSVASEPGKGSVFSVVLSCGEEASP